MLDLRLMIIWTRVNLAPSYSDNYILSCPHYATPERCEGNYLSSECFAEFEHTATTDADWNIHLSTVEIRGKFFIEFSTFLITSCAFPSIVRLYLPQSCWKYFLPGKHIKNMIRTPIAVNKSAACEVVRQARKLKENFFLSVTGKRNLSFSPGDMVRNGWYADAHTCTGEILRVM